MLSKMQKDKQTTTQKVLRNSFYNFLTTIISKVGGLIFTIIVARILLPELFGVYTLALTVVLTISIFTDLGINGTLIRYLAESLKTKTTKANAEARARLRFLLNFKLLLTAVAALALFLLANILAVYVFKKPLLELPLKLGAIYLFIISLQGFFSAAFYAIQKVRYSAISETIFQILRIALLFVFFMFYKNVSSVFIVLMISMFISYLFLHMALSRDSSSLLRGPRLRIEGKERKRLLGFFGWLTISSISLVFFVNIDDFMLGMFLPAAKFVGYYSAISSIIGAVAALVTFGTTLLPTFTQIEKGAFERGFRKVFHYLALVAIPAAIGLAFIMVPAIKAIYGAAYVPTEYNFAILLTSILLSLTVIETAFTALFSTLFQAKERPKIPSLLIVIATIVNIVLNYAFIKIGLTFGPQYGLVAVALATVISRYGNMVALAVLTRKKLKLRGGWISTIKPLIASAVMLGVLFAFSHFVGPSAWAWIIEIVLATIVYFGIMLLIRGIKKEDFKLMKALK